MHDTLITFQGNVGGDVAVRRAGDAPVANFRVACTPRRYVRKDDAWVDDDTQWYSVSAWRALGEHCARSLRRGDPVFVQGRLRARSWTNSAGAEVTTLEVEAVTVGHDLSRGTSTFSRPARPSDGPAPAADQTAAPGDAGDAPDAAPGSPSPAAA